MGCCIITIAILCKLRLKGWDIRAYDSRNSSDPAQMADVCAGPRADDIAPDDPNHSISGVNMQSLSVLPKLGSKFNALQFSVHGTQMRSSQTLPLKLRTCAGL
jgi:hypothetical protein